MAALVQCGELCKPCGTVCGRDYADGAVGIECPVCSGAADECEHCSDGVFYLDRCPRTLMSPAFIRAVNLAAVAGDGDWPVAGGLLDQAAWFVDLYMRLKSEVNRIERMKTNRGK